MLSIPSGSPLAPPPPPPALTPAWEGAGGLWTPGLLGVTIVGVDMAQEQELELEQEQGKVQEQEIGQGVEVTTSIFQKIAR